MFVCGHVQNTNGRSLAGQCVTWLLNIKMKCAEKAELKFRPSGKCIYPSVAS